MSEAGLLWPAVPAEEPLVKQVNIFSLQKRWNSLLVSFLWIFLSFSSSHAQVKKDSTKKSQNQTVNLKASKKSSAKPNVSKAALTSSSKKSRQNSSGLPRKLKPAREMTAIPEGQQSVIVSSVQTMSSHSLRGDGKALTPVYLFSLNGDMTGLNFKALHVGEQMLAVKIEQVVTFIDLLSNYRLYYQTEDKSLIEIQFVSVDFEQNLALMKMVKPDLKSYVYSWPKTMTPQTAMQFGMTPQEMLSVLTQLRSQVSPEQSRQTASAGRNPAAVIQSKLLGRAQKLTNDFVQSTEPLRIGKNMLATKPPGTRCGPKSPEVSTPGLQKEILTAWSMNCAWSEPLNLSSSLQQYIGLTSGMIYLKKGMNFSDDKRLQLIQEISGEHEKSLIQSSTNVQYSTQSHCEKSFLTDRRVDVYYCTRNFKLLPMLSDSFLIMGTLRGDEYLYTLVRASGFSAEMNQNISNKILTSLGRNL